MNWPTSQDYNEAVQNASSSFSDSALKNGEVVVNAIGLPVPRSGNFADVYQFKGGDGKTWALKCFTRKVAGLQERYTKIDEHIAKANFPFTVGFNYLADGVRIKGQWFPVLKMEWVEGFTLNEFVRDNAAKPNYLHALMQMWAKLCGRLRDGNFAHADLQHGNVLLVPGDSQNKLGLKLIDYDGMWVPALAEHHSGEIGHPNFQSPLRLKDRLYNADVDRFPHLVIATALRATLLGGRALWDKFDNGDNLLFKEADLRDPAKAPVFKTLWELNDDVLCALLGKMALASKDPLRKTPWLDDILLEEGGLRLTDDEEKKVMQLLGVGAHFTTVKPAASAQSAPAEAAFNDFEVVDGVDDVEDQKTVARRAAKKVSPAKKQTAKQKEKPAAKSMLPVYAGGGVLAAALIVGIVVATSGGGKKDKATEQEVAKGESADHSMPVPVIPKKKEGADLAKIVEPPNTGGPKDPPMEVKKDPPAEVKNDPPVKIANNLGERPPPLAVNTSSAVLSLAAIPNSRDVLMARRGLKGLFRGINNNGKFEQIQIGNHLGPVRTVACASDGSKAVSGGDDNAVRVWSLNAPRQLHELKEHTQPVTICAVSPDNSRAVSIGLDSLLCEWDINEGKLIRKCQVPACRALAYLPDGKTLLLGTTNQSALLFDLDKQQRVKELPGHQGAVNAVCVTKDGKLGYTAGEDAVIQVWSLPGGEKVSSLVKHMGSIVGMCLTPDGYILMSVDANNQIHLWGRGSVKDRGAASLPRKTHCLAVVDAGDMYAAGMGEDIGPGTLMFSDLNVPKKPVQFVKKDPPQSKMTGEFKEVWNKSLSLSGSGFSPDGSTVMTAGGKQLRVISAKDGALIENQTLSEFVDELAICPDGSVLLRSASNSNGIVHRDLMCWDTRSKTQRFTIDLGVNHNSWSLAAKANQVLVAPAAGFYSVHSLVDGKKLEDIKIPTSNALLYALCCTADGEAVLIVEQPGNVYFRAKKDEPFRTLTKIDPIKTGLPGFALSPNAKYYLKYGDNARTEIDVYETATGDKIATLDGHTRFVQGARFVRGAAFSPDSRHIISIGDNTLRMWNVENGKEIQKVIPDQARPVVSLAISANGSHALISTGQLYLWRLPEGDAPAIVKKDAPLEGAAPHLKEVGKINQKMANFGLDLSANGDKLFVSAPTNDVRIYKTSGGQFLNAVPNGTPPYFVLAVPESDRILMGYRRNIGNHDIVTKQTTTLSLQGTREFLVKKPTLLGKETYLVPDAFDGVVVLNTADSNQLSRFRLPSVHPFIAVSCSADGQTMIVLNTAGDIFSKPAGAAEFKLLGNYPKALTAEMTPDGKQFLVAYDLSPVLYDANGKEIVTFEGKFGFVRHVSFVNGGRQAISVHGNGALRLWETQTGKLIQKIDLPGAGVHVAVSADGRSVAAAVNNPDVIQIYRLESNGPPAGPDPIIGKKTDPKMPAEGPVATSEALPDRIVESFYSSDGKKIYACASGGVVHVLDPLTLKETTKYTITDAKIVDAVAAPKSPAPTANRAKEWLYVLDDQKRIHIFDVEKRAAARNPLSFVTQMTDLNSSNYRLSITPDLQTLLITSKSVWRTIYWNLKNSLELGLEPLQRTPFKISTRTIAFSADGRFGAASTSNTTSSFNGIITHNPAKVMIWNAKTGAEISLFEAQTPRQLAIVPEANLLVAAGPQQFVAWNFLTGKQIWNENANLALGGLLAIPKSKRVAYAHQSELVIRDAVTGEETHRWKTPDMVTSLAVSSDGKFLMTCGNDQKMRIWAVPAAVGAKKP